jgi:hypothetical protein
LEDRWIAHPVREGLEGLSCVGRSRQAQGDHAWGLADEPQLDPQVRGLLDDAEHFQPPAAVSGHEITTVEGAKNPTAMRGTGRSVGHERHGAKSCKFIATVVRRK